METLTVSRILYTHTIVHYLLTNLLFAYCEWGLSAYRLQAQPIIIVFREGDRPSLGIRTKSGHMHVDTRMMHLFCVCLRTELLSQQWSCTVTSYRCCRRCVIVRRWANWGERHAPVTAHPQRSCRRLQANQTRTSRSACSKTHATSPDQYDRQ